ncbi:MAG: hypothetical protein POG24_09105 [Acidocella sp.]|nr:hypothetical protein [Acidocella sp.]MDE8350213.1 hypothetical protein [Acidocella sp.]
MSLAQVPASVFLQDFGLPVTFGGLNAIGILDSPTEEILGNMVLSVDYKLTFATATLPGLDSGASVTVNGVAYTVRSVRMESDGVFSAAIMSKV